jgi:hypothetical protein
MEELKFNSLRRRLGAAADLPVKHMLLNRFMKMSEWSTENTRQVSMWTARS